MAWQPIDSPDGATAPSPPSDTPAPAETPKPSGKWQPYDAVSGTTGGGGGGGGGEDPGMLEAAGWGLLDVPTAGWGSHAKAAVGAALGVGGDESYAQRLAENKARSEAAWQAHPIAYGVGGAGGMLGATALGAGPEELAARLGVSGTRAAMAGGAGYGAAYGLGEGEDAGDKLNRAAWGAATGGLGGAAAAKIAPMISKSLAGIPGRQAVVDAGGRLGVSVPRFMVANQPLQQISKASESLPFFGQPIRAAAQKTTSELGQAVDQAVGSSTPLTAGQKISEATKQWIKPDPASPLTSPTSKTPVDAAYAATQQSITNPAAQTPLSGLKAVGDSIDADRLRIGLKPSPVVDFVRDAMNNPNGLTFNDTTKLRSALGEWLKRQNILPADVEGEDAKKLYKALSADQQTAAFNAGGQRTVNLFNQANTLAQEAANNRKTLVKVVGGRGQNNPEAVFNMMNQAAKDKGGNLGLIQLAKSKLDPGAWSELGPGMASQLGRDAEGKFGFQKFVGDWGKLGNDAKNEIFDPQLRQTLDDTATVASQMKNVSIFNNPSGTGHAVGLLGLIEAIPHIIAHPVMGTAAAVGGLTFGKVMANPVTAQANLNFIRTLRNYAVNQTNQRTSPQFRQMVGRAASNYSRALAGQFGASIAPIDFIHGLGLQ